MIRRLLVKTTDNYIDVTGKRIIVWSAGNNARYTVLLLQLDNIAYVVDKNADKFNEPVSMYGKLFEVKDITILDELSGNDYFIFIGSEIHRQSIIEDILERYGEKYIICENKDCLYREYTDINDLLWGDPIISAKISYMNVSSKMSDRVICIVNVLNDYGFVVRGYIPIYEGFRISFIAITDKGKYVVHMPGHLCREQYTPSEQQYVLEAYECSKMITDINPLPIYWNEDGIIIEKFADRIEWDDNWIIGALLYIKELHGSGKKFGCNRDPWERMRNREKYIIRTGKYFPQKISEIIKNGVPQILNGYEACPCHGDFHMGNVMSYKGRIVAIDWEWVGMSDPMFDICHLLSHVDSERFMFFYKEYLEREPVKAEIKRALAMRVLDKYMSYLMGIVMGGTYSDEVEMDIIRMMNEVNV